MRFFRGEGRGPFEKGPLPSPRPPSLSRKLSLRRMTRHGDTATCRVSPSPDNAHQKSASSCPHIPQEKHHGPAELVPAGPLYSIFSLKHFAFQTMRPVVSLKKRSFSNQFRHGSVMPPVVTDAFRKRQPGNNYAPRSYRRETATSGKRARPRNAPFSRIKRVGGRMGVWGKETPLRASQGGFLPPAKYL